MIILETDEDVEISVESLDDFVIEKNLEPINLHQVKYHDAAATSLNEQSVDFWKTMRVWCESLKNKQISNNTKLTLITTSIISEDCILRSLKPNEHQPDYSDIVSRLDEVAQQGTNVQLDKAYKSYLNLTTNEKLILVKNITLLDQRPGILDIPKLIKRCIRYAPRQENQLDLVYRDLAGWWVDEIIKSFNDRENMSISQKQIRRQISDIVEQYRRDNLPLHYINKNPPIPSRKKIEKMLFVKQLTDIGLPPNRIDFSVIDYYKAFYQRARWIKDSLLFDSDLETYDDRLIKEWQRFCLDYMMDQKDINSMDEAELLKYGQKILKWAERESSVKIRELVTERYVINGSYHMLADKKPPKVWWHPFFKKNNMELLKI